MRGTLQNIITKGVRTRNPEKRQLKRSPSPNKELVLAQYFVTHAQLIARFDHQALSGYQVRLCTETATLVYSTAMMIEHPKTVRRRMLTLLYERFLQYPAEMFAADDLMTIGEFAREDMVVNMFYLADSGLVEMITSYRPNWFEAARILPAGIDLVENRFVFDQRFPPALPEEEAEASALLFHMERLAEQAEYAGVDGEIRHALLRDVRFLREELARPRRRWRREVIESALRWIAAAVETDPDALPALPLLREALQDQSRP